MVRSQTKFTICPYLGITSTCAKTKGSKMDSRSEVCMFVGYPKGTRGGLFYSSQDRKVIVSIHFTSLDEDYMNNFKPKSKVILEELSGDQVDAQLSMPVTEQEEQ